MKHLAKNYVTLKEFLDTFYEKHIRVMYYVKTAQKLKVKAVGPTLKNISL